MNLLILECMPSNGGLNEGLVLYEFLKMVSPDDTDVVVQLFRISSKNQLIKYLKNKKDLDEFDYVHLSGHGDAAKRTFATPKGRLTPEDFPEGCFEDMTVTFSSCTLGRSAFANDFMSRTWAKNVIGPMNEVKFIDSAMWFVYFYYWVLHKGVRAPTAYDRVKGATNGEVKGGFQMWQQAALP